MAGEATERVQFGDFEVDLRGRELRKAGRPVRLQDQPFRILKTLVQRPGAIVSREELREEVWGDDVYVDFDRSLNTAVARLREALGDSPTRPTYIETIPRRGYRFVAQIGDSPADRLDPALRASAQPARRDRAAWVAGAVVAATAAASVYLWLRPPEREVAPPQQPIALTTYPGVETDPAFSPEGKQVAFSWTGPNDDNADIYVQVVHGELLNP